MAPNRSGKNYDRKALNWCHDKRAQDQPTEFKHDATATHTVSAVIASALVLVPVPEFAFVVALATTDHLPESTD